MMMIDEEEQDQVNYAVSEKKVGCDDANKDDNVDRGYSGDRVTRLTG